jgi:hypothetical protein
MPQEVMPSRRASGDGDFSALSWETTASRDANRGDCTWGACSLMGDAAPLQPASKSTIPRNKARRIEYSRRGSTSIDSEQSQIH